MSKSSITANAPLPSSSAGEVFSSISFSAAQTKKAFVAEDRLEHRRNIGESRWPAYGRPGALEEFKRTATPGASWQSTHDLLAGALKQLEAQIEKLRADSARLRASQRTSFSSRAGT